MQETFAGRINLQRKLSIPLQSMPYSKAPTSIRDNAAAAQSLRGTATSMKEVAKLPLLEAIKVIHVFDCAVKIFHRTRPAQLASVW